MIKRSNIEQFTSRINEHRSFIQVLVGPRQVGKTTLVLQLLEETILPNMFESADAVLNSNSEWILQIWETARLRMKAIQASEFLLVIDEVQKIDNWSEIVKQQWDRDTREKINIKVILLGSSRLLIQKGLTESLAGRFEITHLGHWSFLEMEKAFGWSVEEYIYFGGPSGDWQIIRDNAIEGY